MKPYPRPVTVTEDEVEQRDASRRPRWPWLVAIGVFVLVAAGVPTGIWFVHWRSSLHSLSEYPTYGVGGPLAIGKTEYLGGNLWAQDTITHPSRPMELSLHISMIRPVVVTNTAGADIRILRCVLALDGPGPEGDASGRSRCASLSPFESGDITLGFQRGDDDIVIAVTPRRAGKVRIAGVEVHYSSGLRHGTQHTGVQIWTSTT